MSEDTRTDVDTPEFGPSGYLPDRAARRARKIVLRSPLGLQWMVASLLAGVVVVVAGVLFLSRSGAPPPAPWVDAGAVEVIGAARTHADLEVLLVGAGGRIRAFAEVDEIAYCPASNRLEAPDGRVWTLTGRGLGGAISLDEHPTLVHDGRVYLDPTRTSPAPAASSEVVEAGCH